MAVRFVSVKCPNCNASLNIEEERTTVFCTYCGSKVLMQNENEYVYREIDEAGMKQAETDRIIRLKQMELEEKKLAAAEKTKQVKILFTVVLAAVGILIMIIGFSPAFADSFLGIVGMFPLLGSVCIWLMSGKENEKEGADV